jgi:hypothetical protein
MSKYLCNLRPGQRVERQDHRTQDPPQIREHRGLLDVGKRVHQNLSVQWVDARPSLMNGAVRRGNDELEAFVRLVMLRFDEPGQGGRENE